MTPVVFVTRSDTLGRGERKKLPRRSGGVPQGLGPIRAVGAQRSRGGSGQLRCSRQGQTAALGHERLRVNPGQQEHGTEGAQDPAASQGHCRRGRSQRQAGLRHRRPTRAGGNFQGQFEGLEKRFKKHLNLVIDFRSSGTTTTGPLRSLRTSSCSSRETGAPSSSTRPSSTTLALTRWLPLIRPEKLRASADCL